MMQMYSEERLQDKKCPKCGYPAVWENRVDITNGSYDDDEERIDGFIELEVKSERSGVCSECGRKHICEVTYRVPNQKGL